MSWPLYELLKAYWLASHPYATPAEYEAAMREIATQASV